MWAGDEREGGVALDVGGGRMSGSLGEEMCERMREEIVTGVVCRPMVVPDRILTPIFDLDIGPGLSLEQTKARLWTPWGCMWVVDV